MKKTWFITLAIIGFAAASLILLSFKSEEGSGKFLFMRTFENGSALSNSYIIITNGESTIKVVEMPITRPKNQEEVSKLISKEIAAILAQGYKLTGTNSGGGDTFLITNYIFEK